ncbi:MAG: LysM peptidoglycan-binding domain-containing protein [Chloroflexi bacterium]|nr:LysM peptidoglycan-binding domain-containing protein [Chloroflexota bacterium]
MPTTRGGLEPALVINKNTGDQVACMFNPYEYTLTKRNEFESGKTKGKNIPKISFKQGGAQSLRLRLLFDTVSDQSDVREITAPLWKMMMIDADRANARTGKGEPPHVIFRWGRFELEAVITDMNQKMTLFLKDGTPVRTTVEMTLLQVVDDTQYAKQNPTSGGGIAPRTRTLYAGDRLDLIAWQEYEDCSQWRRIAEANQLSDPLNLRAGQVIQIPPME